MKYRMARAERERKEFERREASRARINEILKETKLNTMMRSTHTCSRLFL